MSGVDAELSTEHREVERGPIREADDRLNDALLRCKTLARERARLHRAAKRLIAAIDEDDDSVQEYLNALAALRREVGA